ncbi:MAG: hypothetical protein K9H26_18945 [Prolixibacteraceae bacterium]|nr:hypothetical protein [Prolixibacteraceae bacterium]
MRFIKGQSRAQFNLFPISLDEAIDKDNEVGLIDLFVDRLDLDKMGFQTTFVENGRPAYRPADLLKLFIYIFSHLALKKGNYNYFAMAA